MNEQLIDDGERAFPGPCQHEQECDINEGMSLRDWFAGHVTYEEIKTLQYESRSPISFAEARYELADAMLVARKTGAT